MILKDSPSAVLPRIPERHKVPGVCYAFDTDGVELPVIDITLPRFQCYPSQNELNAISQKSIQALRTTAKYPGFFQKFLARRSLIMRGTLAASGSVMSGMATYILKLGPENLGRGYAGKLDHRMALFMAPTALRMRLQSLAHLLAEQMVPALKARPTSQLHLINIAGGTAADSFNAVLILRKNHPELLANRAVTVTILDIDQAGPQFGIRAVAALTAADGPLHGTQLMVNHVPYDWKKTHQLRTVLESLPDDAIVAVSSEGGLGEYASDKEILVNLLVLASMTPDDCPVVLTAMRDERSADPCLAAMKATGRMPSVRFFSAEVLQVLAEQSGWRICQLVEGNPLYHILCLGKKS